MDSLRYILAVGAKMSRIDVVFDDYRESSINLLCAKPLSEESVFRLCKFFFLTISDDWLNLNTKCSNNEEADTRMILHANHASSNSDQIVISSLLTLMFLLFVLHSSTLLAQFFPHKSGQF